MLVVTLGIPSACLWVLVGVFCTGGRLTPAHRQVLIGVSWGTGPCGETAASA